MKHRYKILRYLLLVGLVLVAGWVWFVRLRTPPWNIVEAGARLTSDNLDVTSRTLVVVPPEPGVVFSTVRKPGDKEQFAYILLLRYDRRITSYGSRIVRPGPDSPSAPAAQLEHAGRWAETTAAFDLNGKHVEASYRVELNETRTAVASERLAVGGDTVDMTSGQAFLVDLRTERPMYRQMKVQLPPTPMRLATKEDAEQAAKAIRDTLAGQDREIWAFLH